MSLTESAKKLEKLLDAGASSDEATDAVLGPFKSFITCVPNAPYQIFGRRYDDDKVMVVELVAIRPSHMSEQDWSAACEEAADEVRNAGGVVLTGADAEGLLAAHRLNRQPSAGEA